MRESQVSRTAEITAASRARHHRSADPAILFDPFAIHLTTPLWRRIVGTPLLDWLVFDLLLGSLSPVGTQVVLRTRYAEDALEAALADGMDQYVILNAGLDSFALRRPELAARVRVFEVDHPANQARKRRRVAEMGRELPSNLELVSVDVEHETIAQGLSRSRFQRDRPAFFSWLGATAHLTDAATLATLRSISHIAEVGSEIVFDHLVPADTLAPRDVSVLAGLKRFAARRGEPLLGEFHPQFLPTVLREVGWELIEHVSGGEQARRYLEGREDNLVPLAASYLAHARVRPR